MLILEIIKSIVYGIIEGITEWLPISSTGHLILFEELFWKSSNNPDFFELFRVVIQLGAILAVILMSELFKVSGLYSIFLNILSPVFNFFGIPIELIELIILKPFSGSGSLALLNEIYKTYGTSGYIPLCASAIFGSSETIFYVTAIYYVKCKNKNAVKGIIISLTATFITICFACLLCRLFV